MYYKNALFYAGIIIPILIAVIFVPRQWKKTTQEPKTTPPVETKSLFELEEYRSINLDDVEKIEIVRYTEGGSDTKEITDSEEMTNTKYYLLNLRVGQEVNTACEDNTTVYHLYFPDNKVVKIEIECDWLILGQKRYQITRSK